MLIVGAAMLPDEKLWRLLDNPDSRLYKTLAENREALVGLYWSRKEQGRWQSPPPGESPMRAMFKMLEMIDNVGS